MMKDLKVKYMVSSKVNRLKERHNYSNVIDKTFPLIIVFPYTIFVENFYIFNINFNSHDFREDVLTRVFFFL